MKNNLIIIGIAVVLSVVLSGILTKPVQTVVERTVGSASSPSVIDGCMDVNGMVTCSYSTATTLTSVGVASSTACSFRSPSATSTLVYASYKVASTSATATYLEIGKGTSYFSTTTLLASGTISADVKGTFYTVATTTSSGGSTVDGAFTITPSNWVVFRTGGSLQTGGVCKAEFIVN